MLYDAILDAETVLVTNSCLAFAIMSKDKVDYRQCETEALTVCLRLFYGAALLM